MNTVKNFNFDTINVFLFIIVLLVNFIGVFNPIFNGDSAMYATVSKNIAFSNDFINLNNSIQENWIDKPHFGFWIWAIFIKIFGNTIFAFKFCTFCSLLVLLRYLYLFTKTYYTETTAFLACIILTSTLHIFIATNDARLDMFLITFMMAAIYYYQKFINTTQILYLIVASFFVALGVMTKGVFIIIPITISIVAQLIFTKSYNKLFSPIWFLSLLCIGVFIIPELYALKIQFESYKDTLILGQKPSNFCQFFFWDSQFGRFNSNLGQLQASGDPFFYLHTFLWAFAPWTLLILKFKFKPYKEYFTISALLALLLILSFSKTQLSHHVLIIFPFLSIFLADILLQKSTSNKAKYFNFFHYLVLSFIPLGAICICILIDGNIDFKLQLIILGSIILWVLIYKSKEKELPKIVSFTLVAAIFLGLFLNSIFYPLILKCQSGEQVATYLKEHKQKNEVYLINSNPILLTYFSDSKLIKVSEEQFSTIKIKDTTLILTDASFVSVLNSKAVNFVVLKTFYDYRTTVLSQDFLDFKKRESVLKKQYLIRILPATNTFPKTQSI